MSKKNNQKDNCLKYMIKKFIRIKTPLNFSLTPQNLLYTFR